MKTSLAVLCFLLLLSDAAAQGQRFLVKFRDKGATTHSLTAPQAYLSPRAIERRTRFGIPLDSTDLPVPATYLSAVQGAGAVTLLNVSRWLNQVSIFTTDPAALERIRSLPFVAGADALAASARPGPTPEKGKVAGGRDESSLRFSSVLQNRYNYGQSTLQVALHKGAFLHNIGLRGSGRVIGVLDAGFQNYHQLSSLDSLRARGGILSTWDFVAREASVQEDNAHGVQCLSVIAALLPGQFVGTAPEAAFHLYRTEDAATEYPIEEHNWVCGAERLDSAGGDLISSSLGYSQFDDPSFDYTYADMDGNTTMAARGADLAARKGILVVNSAGNEGNKPWHYIVTPADGDSVMAVGAVDPIGRPAAFTSYGPSADGQVKPDVASVGLATIVQFANGTIGPNNGTSFACPNMAGLAASLWQGFPERNNMAILQALRAAGDQAAAPDDTTGYGIPDMRKAVGILIREHGSMTAAAGGCSIRLSWTTKDHQSMRHFIERKAEGETAFSVIGELGGTGSQFGERTYEFTDGAPPGGQAEYRIRQLLDASDNFSVYLDTVAINTTACVPDGSIVLFPNPAAGKPAFLRIGLPEAIPQAVLTVRNAAGQLLVRRSFQKPAGTYTVHITAQPLPKGVYIVSLYNGERMIFSQKMIE